MLLFGSALVIRLLASVSLADVLLTFVIHLVIRPIIGLTGLVGRRADRYEKPILIVLGIRGVRLINYLAYNLKYIHVAAAERVWDCSSY